MSVVALRTEAGIVRFHDIASALFPPHGVAKYVAVFKFYLDDSRRDGVFALGGYFARLDQWDSFEDEWRIRLHQAGVKVFHATDFYNLRGEFKGWDVPKQIQFAKLFTAIAEKQTDIAIVRAVDEAAYMEILAPALADLCWTPHGKVTPLMWCARTCLEGLIARYYRAIPVADPIAVIFETGDGVGEAIDYFRGLQKLGAPWAKRYTSFADGPKELLPLQAADLIVHEAVRSVREKMKPTGRLVRKSMARLVKTERVEIKLWSRDDLMNAVADVTKLVPPYERKKRR